ncbi:hypothetical protein MLD38_025947 [Melastoma candidum]|uniref:Uncharacterized protein n=1 Tax=Melastoma candidum TaxID=119954 RepID=A0ACB9P260_9MYRT|nr:hypothetical protein MLD38_025947 [Melastoma candidum]
MVDAENKEKKALWMAAVGGLPRGGCDSCLEENSRACSCCDASGLGPCPDLAKIKALDGPCAGANSSFIHAVINMVGMLIGLGQLSTPFALENGGWASSFLLVSLGIIGAYTSHLLGRCLDKNPKLRSYTDIGDAAYGCRGRVIAATFIYLEIFMALVSYTISLHDNLAIVFAGTRIMAPWPNLSTSQLLTMIAVLVALPSLWIRDLSSISFLSSGGILMSILIFVSVALTAIFGGVRSDHHIPALRLRNIPAISGLYIFSYAGHIVFPNLQKSMKDPSNFTKVGFENSSSAFGCVTASIDCDPLPF